MSKKINSSNPFPDKPTFDPWERVSRPGHRYNLVHGPSRKMVRVSGFTLSEALDQLGWNEIECSIVWTGRYGKDRKPSISEFAGKAETSAKGVEK